MHCAIFSILVYGNAEQPHVFAVRWGGVILPNAADWVRSTIKLREAFVRHADVDPSVEGALPA